MRLYGSSLDRNVLAFIFRNTSTTRCYCWHEMVQWIWACLLCGHLTIIDQIVIYSEISVCIGQQSVSYQFFRHPHMLTLRRKIPPSRDQGHTIEWVCVLCLPLVTNVCRSSSTRKMAITFHGQVSVNFTGHCTHIFSEHWVWNNYTGKHRSFVTDFADIA